MLRDTDAMGPGRAPAVGAGSGHAEMCRDHGRPDVPDGGARPSAADAAGDDPSHSPPLSPEEIADIEAIASGSVKLRHVSKSELFRLISEGPKHAERHAPQPAAVGSIAARRD